MSTGHAIVLPPYARSMGMVVDRIEQGVPVIAMDYSDRALGRPGYLHGGAIGGLLEVAGFCALHAALGGADGTTRIKPINVTIEYLRGGTQQPTFAIGTVLRAGRRIANVQAEAWQADRNRPVASCWINFQLSPR